jgi:alkylation response protein AidB-like acyl-CoA dehydrogenase
MLTKNRTDQVHDRAAEDLVPAIEAAAPEIEATGSLPASLLDALHAARLFHMLVPREVGGEQVDLITFFHAIEAIASADASTAWCVGQACGVSMASAYLDPVVAREIFGGPRSVVASGPNTKSARAVKAPGGYRVTGNWLYASGSRHSDWLGGHCTVYESDGTPATSPEGKAMDRTMLFPKSAATVRDVWQVMGLRGTGSDNYSVEDLFVPQEHTFTRDAARDRRVEAPLYSFFTGFNIFGLSFSAVALGLARSMMRDFSALAARKTPQNGNVALAENAVIQSKVAIAQAQMASARALVLDVYGELWDRAVQGQPFSLQDKARMRMASTFAMHQAREVVDFAYHAAGGTAIFAEKPFERRFRDMHCASQQGQASAANFEVIGQVFLGVPPKARV